MLRTSTGDVNQATTWLIYTVVKDVLVYIDYINKHSRWSSIRYINDDRDLDCVKVVMST